jgi:hypothetical protein
MNSSEAEQLNRDILKAARSVAQDWPGVTTADDLAQEVWIKVSELTTRRQESLIALDAKLRASQLRKWCRQAASEERDKYEVLTGNYQYGVDEVRGMLENGWLTIRPSEEYTSNGGRKASFYDAETDSYQITNIPDVLEGQVTDAHNDLLIGFSRLKKRNEGYYNAIGVRYVGALVPRGGSAQKRLERAVTALAQEMNRSWNVRVSEFEGVSTANQRWRR